MSTKDPTQGESMRERALRSEMESKAKVQREQIKLEENDRSSATLRNLGQHFCPRGLEYTGTLTVHMYRANALDTLATVCQIVPNGRSVTLVEAKKAVNELMNQVLANFGKKFQTKRSGL